MTEHSWGVSESVADWSSGGRGQSSDHFTCDRCGEHWQRRGTLWRQSRGWDFGPVFTTETDPPPREGCADKEMKYTVLLTEGEARSLEDEVFRRRTNKLKAANRSAIIREAIGAYLITPTPRQ